MYGAAAGWVPEEQETGLEMSYAVRTKSGRVVGRFATRAAAERACQQTARSPRLALDPSVAEALAVFDAAVRTRPPEGGVAPDGSFVPNTAWQAEASRMYDAFRKTAVRAAKEIPKIAEGDESAVNRFRRVREGLYKQHQAFFSEAPGGAALALIQRLNAINVAAQEVGHKARVAALNADISAAKEREREARFAEATRDPAFYAYQQELKRNRR